MSNLIYLIPIALFLGALGSRGVPVVDERPGQYDDLPTAPAWRVLDDDDDRPRQD